jgi:hypothetical protein
MRRVVPPPVTVTPVRPSTLRTVIPRIGGMEVLQPPQHVRRPSIAPLLGSTVVGTVFIVSGIVLAYVALATPILGSILPDGRLNAGEMATGMAIWAVALVAPAGLLLVGFTKLVRIFTTVRGRVPRRSIVMRALRGASGVVVAPVIALPDGRTVSHLVVGSFGAAVFRELPPPASTRIRDGRWELRTKGGWIPLENPLDRAARDAERVRRWLGHDDADFVVKVYAAVVGPGTTVPRTPDCAVLTPDQIVPWLDALPPQRSLTESRRQQVIDQVRSATT